MFEFLGEIGGLSGFERGQWHRARADLIANRAAPMLRQAVATHGGREYS